MNQDCPNCDTCPYADDPLYCPFLQIKEDKLKYNPMGDYNPVEEWDKVMKSVKTTPSPLDEIEEIEEITGVNRDIGGGVSYTQKNKKVDENLSVLINQLISNQKKLYQLIKEKL